MMKKALLASVLATGLILPAEAGLYIPPKPAIIKSIKDEPHVPLMAMPLTMGMLAPKAIAPVTVLQRATAQVNSSGATTFTFPDMAIGSASSTRRVIACIVADDGSSTTRTLSSATIGGISATIDIQARNSSGGSNVAAIFSATVPTGTTATVAATFNGAMSRGALCWAVAIDGLQQTAARDTLTDTSSPLSGGIDWLKDGFVVAVAGSTGGGASFTWTGVTERFDTSGTSVDAAGGDLLPTSDGTNQTVSTTISGAGTRISMVAASYR